MSENQDLNKPEEKKKKNKLFQINFNKDKQTNKKNKPNSNLPKIFRAIMSWVVLILSVFLILNIWRGEVGTEYEITFTQYQELLNNNLIEKVIIEKTNQNDYDIHGKLRSEQEISLPNGKKTPIQKFTLSFPYTNIDEQILLAWKEHNVQFSFVRKDNIWWNALISIMPWLILLGIWILFFRRMQNGGGGAKGLFSFGKSKAKMMTGDSIKITFADVAGADEAKFELQEIIEFLKEPAKFQKLGGKIPRGVLLLGPPGTGKTLMARAVAGEAGVPFFSISGADFVEMFVGVGASRVRDLFEQAKRTAPCIVFIDEIDAVGRQRGAGLGGGHDEREQTLNQLLVEMDGFEQNSSVIIIAATNRPDVLDPALLRPGRFDRQVVVDRPDVRGREGILKVHTRNIPLGEDVKLEILAKGSPGLSGADLANLVNEAALLAARQNDTKVHMKHFEEARDKVMMGMERKSLIISEREKRITAYHESGHVLVAKMIPEADPVHKVTIIPRGRALGVTTYLPIDEKHTYSKKYLEAMITYAFGGRAAEKIVFNEETTGAGNDIERASSLARKMVCEWGMSDKLGPLAYGTKEEEVFLGKEITRQKNYSDETTHLIDEEVKKIIITSMNRAEKILKENIDKLHLLSNVLLEREILDSEEIDKVLRGELLPPLVLNNNNSNANNVTPAASTEPPKNGRKKSVKPKS